MLEKFPTMPPFGPNWFGPIEDPGNPIGALRSLWIALNIHEDKRLAREERKQEIEYFGLFANPEIYFKIKKLSNEDSPEGDVSGPMKIVHDYTDYNRRLNLAMTGVREIHDPRPDVAERVREKRVEIAEANQRRQQVADSRIHTYEDNDDLIVERPKK